MGGNFIWRIVVACLALTPVCYLAVSGKTVAFSVAKTAAQSTSSNDVVVTFDKEFLNVGNIFNLSTSTFDCPIEGIYVFHFYGLTKRPENRFLIGLHHNGRSTVRAYARDLWGSGGNAIVLSLAVGDTVQIKSEYGTSGLYASEGDIYVTFSGYLLESFC